MVGEFSAWHMPNVQLDFGRISRQGVGCVGHGVGAARTIAQQKLHILSSVVLHHFGGRELQEDAHHIAGDFFHRGNADRHFFHGEGVC